MKIMHLVTSLFWDIDLIMCELTLLCNQLVKTFGGLSVEIGCGWSCKNTPVLKHRSNTNHAGGLNLSSYMACWSTNEC